MDQNIRVKRRREWLFLPCSRKVLAFPCKFEHLLLLYEYGVQVLQMLSSFLRLGLESGELCLFVYNNDETNRFRFEREFREDTESRRLYAFPIAVRGGRSHHMR